MVTLSVEMERTHTWLRLLVGCGLVGVRLRDRERMSKPEGELGDRKEVGRELAPVSMATSLPSNSSYVCTQTPQW